MQTQDIYLWIILINCYALPRVPLARDHYPRGWWSFHRVFSGYVLFRGYIISIRSTTSPKDPVRSAARLSFSPTNFSFVKLKETRYYIPSLRVQTLPINLIEALLYPTLYLVLRPLKQIARGFRLIPRYLSLARVTKTEMIARFQKLNTDHVFEIVWHWIHRRFVSPSASSITGKREIKAIRRRAVLNLLQY